MKFAPTSRGVVKGILCFSAGGGNQRFVKFSADVQHPHVVAEQPTLNFGAVYFDMHAQLETVLRNLSQLPTSFEVGKPVPYDNDPRSRLDPSTFFTALQKSGRIQPRGSATIGFSICFYKPQGNNFVTPVLNHIVPIYIDGQPAPVLVRLRGAVEGITVKYHLSEQSETQPEDISLDFGTNNVRKPITRKVYITNLSPIVTTYSFSVSGFPILKKQRFVEAEVGPAAAALKSQTTILATAKQTRTVAPTAVGNRASKTGKLVLSATGNKDVPPPIKMSATGKSRTQRLLEVKEDMRESTDKIPRGAAVAFEVVPSSIELQAYSTICVTVTFHNHIPGVYEDTLLCKTPLLPLFKIPIRAASFGCPLQFQLGRPGDDAAPIIRLRPVDVRWEGFSCPEDDHCLLDLMWDFSDDGRVHIRPRIHDGIRSDIPFSATPATFKILACSSMNVNVHFRSFKSGDFFGFVRGIVSPILPPPPKYVETANSGYFSLKYGMGSEEESSLKLLMTGRAYDPRLSFVVDEGKVEFTADSFNVVNQPARMFDMTKSIVMSNLTPAELAFSTKTSGMFSVINIDSSLPSAGNGVTRVGPSETVKITLTCRVSKADLIDSIRNGKGNFRVESSAPSGETTGVMARTAHSQGRIDIKFANRSEQMVPMEAIFQLPVVLASTSAIDFGNCMVSKSKTRVFSITNYSHSKFGWTTSITSSMDSSTAEAFKVVVGGEGEVESVSSGLPTRDAWQAGGCRSADDESHYQSALPQCSGDPSGRSLCPD